MEIASTGLSSTSSGSRTMDEINEIIEKVDTYGGWMEMIATWYAGGRVWRKLQRKSAGR